MGKTKKSKGKSQKFENANNPSLVGQNYDSESIEKKWQEYWEEHKIFSPDLDLAKKPWYNLMMFPYPSAEGMHVGNMYAFTGSDVYARFKRMQGYDVFEPIGLDGFGIHSENYALKIGHHPMEQAKVSQANFYRQLRATGNSYDWTRTLETYDPNYYKWTQWLFIKMFKHGLAYRKKAQVNWCPSCKTVLADEQVITGECERCGSVVEKRELEQWFFKITQYSDRLLNNIRDLNWTEKVKVAQREWIGKKEGINITYEVKDSDLKVNCFTTRPDTNFGATFIVIGPEHKLAQKLATPEYEKKVVEYINETKKVSDQERIALGRRKTGVFTGSFAINNLNGKELPIWVSDFVLGDVGTGAVVGVPGHDKRDFEFAKAFDLPIIRVVVGKDGDTSAITKIEQVQEEEGTMINSEFLNDMDINGATKKIMDYLEEKGWGERVTTYHLRDWLISRQRYWGAPIPMVYCSSCAQVGRSWFTSKEAQSQHRKISNIKNQISSKNQTIRNSAGWYPIPEDELPVLLPHIQDYKPLGTGKAPLANHPEFYNVKCPECGSDARRETDVSDTFLDSAWYFFRYLSTEREEIAFDIVRASNWLPVSIYIGGAEHSVLHLLYSRFVTMFLHDLKLIQFEEPYARFFAHGLIIKEGAKMSKSRGNVVIPDEYITKYGADTLRLYLMFLGPFSQGGDFRDSGIEGMSRFVRRVWKLLSAGSVKSPSTPATRMSPERFKIMHKTIKKVTKDIDQLHYNTAISSLMEWYNYLSQKLKVKGQKLFSEESETFLKLLAPFAPYMTEELWQQLTINELQLTNKSTVNLRPEPFGLNTQMFDSEVAQTRGGRKLRSREGQMSKVQSIHLQSWPQYDEKYLIQDKIIIVVQVNGKKRAEMKVDTSESKNKEKLQRSAQTMVLKYLEGKTVKNVVYVPGKIINFVIN